MSKVRRIKKNAKQHNYTVQFADMKKCLDEQQVMLESISRKLVNDNKVYQALKAHQNMEHLKTYISLRDAMMEDLFEYEQRGQTNTRGYSKLVMYVNQLTDILENYGVEILEACPGMPFDADTQKPLKRVEAFRKEDHERLYRVYNCGYRKGDYVLKKMYVDVCIYR